MFWSVNLWTRNF